MSRNHEMNRSYGVHSALFIQPLSQPAACGLEDEDLALELDEPPEDHYTTSPQSYAPQPTSPTTASCPVEGRDVYRRQPPTPLDRRCSLLTRGLLSTSSLHDLPSPTNNMARASSQASAYSLTSNHGLTSDGGFSSPAHSGTPSPPLPAAMESGAAGAAPKARTIKFAGDKSSEKPAPARKTCISFACAPATKSTATEKTDSGAEAPKRPCTIRFACNSRPTNAAPPKIVTPPRKQTPTDSQQTPRRVGSPFPTSSRRRSSQSTPVACRSGPEQGKTLTVPEACSPSQARKLEKERLKKLASNRPEDEAWVNEKPKERKPLTVSDTLRKENAIRQLAQEAEQEALEEAMDEIIDEEEDEEEEDQPATGSRYMAFDEDDSDGGHETDDEGGFAESDDESDEDPDFQFWTNGHSTAATSADHHHTLELPRPKCERTMSESSFDSVFRHDCNSGMTFIPSKTRRRRSPKAMKMRPGTPELPDSTDFVCGTLDEDRPLEEAYLSCLKQRKLEKQGIIPQDLDPSFPTSDPENNDDEEDEITEGVASTASDHHFLGGRFDESDGSLERGRSVTTAIVPSIKSPSPVPMQHEKSPAATPAQKGRAKSPAPVPMQRVGTKSPAPAPMQRLRTKSPAPVAMQRIRTKSPAPSVRHRAKSPAPCGLFNRSPIRPNSPVAASLVLSPPASPKGIKVQAAGLGERPGQVTTASLPHTPNPFFIIQERRMRASKRAMLHAENHNRGPIDIKQGLEDRKLRRKEQYWRKHCRDHKDKSRRCAPGKGAQRMRELGLEMADRNKAYGQKLELMLSV